MSDNLEYEKRCIEEGYANIAGVDEVGRGPLAGPVTVCAVIMPLEQDKIIDGVTDSKKLSAKKREKLCAEILERAIACNVVSLPPEYIDEVNILCCMVAKDLGAQHTVIINNNERYYDQIEHLRERFNMNLSVSPEKEAASEVARMLRFPSALQVELFADGKMELIDVILPENSEFVGCSIASKHGKAYPDVQICAVERDGEIIIPTGNLVLEPGDRLSIASTVTGIVKYLKSTGMYQTRIKRVMILGGGNSSYYLAKQILAAGMSVTIIENDFERCRYLSEQLPKAMIIRGSDDDYELMRNEGLTESDAFVAFTTNNEKNIIAGLYAVNKNVPKVIVSVDEYNLFSVMGELDIGSVVSQNVLTATRILHFVKGLQSAKDLGSKLNAIFTLGGSDAYVLEFTVNEMFSASNMPIKE